MKNKPWMIITLSCWTTSFIWSAWCSASDIPGPSFWLGIAVIIIIQLMACKDLADAKWHFDRARNHDSLPVVSEQDFYDAYKSPSNSFSVKMEETY